MGEKVANMRLQHILENKKLTIEEISINLDVNVQAAIVTLGTHVFNATRSESVKNTVSMSTALMEVKEQIEEYAETLFQHYNNNDENMHYHKFKNKE